MWPARPAPNAPSGPGQVNGPATGERWVPTGAVAGAGAGRRRFLRLRCFFGGAGALTTIGSPARTPPLPLVAAEATSGTRSASTSIMTRARAMGSGSTVTPRPRALQRIAQTPTTRFSSSAEPFLLSGSLRLPHFGDCTHDGQPDLHGHSEISRRASSQIRSNAP